MQKRMTFATPNFYSSVCNMKNFIYLCKITYFLNILYVEINDGFWKGGASF